MNWRGLFLSSAFVVFGSPAALACVQVTMTPNYLNFWVNGYGAGTVCNISNFTPPWNNLLGMQLGPGKGLFAVEYEPKQYGHIYFQIDGTGNGRITFFYSNMKQFDSDEFAIQVEFLDANGVLVGIIDSRQRVRYRSTLTEARPVSADPDYWRSIAAIRFRHSPLTELGGGSPEWFAMLSQAKAACDAADGRCKSF